MMWARGWSVLLVAGGLGAQGLAQTGTCGPCPFPGACPPTYPMGQGPGEDHRCEFWAGAQLAQVDLSLADLGSADFSSANLNATDLTGANLGGAQLSFVSLFLANLEEATLAGAILNVANLSGADLTSADMSGAKLLLANLAGANLRGAELVSTDFFGAVLAGADLAGSDLTGAVLAGCQLSGADLTCTVGLSSTVGGALYDACTEFTGTGFDPVAAGWTLQPAAAPLVTCIGEETIPLSQGGSQRLFLDAGLVSALDPYFLLGSASGTVPGQPADGGLTVPLNLDAYFVFTLLSPNTPILTSSLGFLDAQGNGQASFNTPAGLSPTLAGVTLNHAYVVLDFLSNPPQTVFASNAVPVTFVP